MPRIILVYFSWSISPHKFIDVGIPIILSCPCRLSHFYCPNFHIFSLCLITYVSEHKSLLLDWLPTNKWHTRINNWAASSEFGPCRLCEQRRFRRACASAQSHQNLHCSLIQAASQEEPSDRKLDPWPLWMAGHAQLQFVMTECSKTQIRLTWLNWNQNFRLYGVIKKHYY